ncbi:MAG: DUF2132 domain-containing protein [Gammaproteobacteria bacterium]|nr:DUF2132 domain-containing protein [Gammaproteobacteria bacterium]
MTEKNETADHSAPEKRQHPKDPLHGLSLKVIVTTLEAQYGWEKLAELIPINCFKSDPSIKSSLTFLRKTPWARTKVEALYIRSKENWGKYNKTE